MDPAARRVRHQAAVLQLPARARPAGLRLRAAGAAAPARRRPRRRRGDRPGGRRRRAAGRPDPVPAGPSAAARRGVALRSLPGASAPLPAPAAGHRPGQRGGQPRRAARRNPRTLPPDLPPLRPAGQRRGRFQPARQLPGPAVATLSPVPGRRRGKPAATPSAATLRAAPGSLHAAAASRGRQLRRGDTDVQPADVPAPGRRYRRAGLSLRASRRRRRRTVLGLPAPSRTLAPARRTGTAALRRRLVRRVPAQGRAAGGTGGPTGRRADRGTRPRGPRPGPRGGDRPVRPALLAGAAAAPRRPSADVAHHRSAHPYLHGALAQRAGRLQRIVGDTAKAPLVALLEQREKRWQAQPKRHFRLPFERWPQTLGEMRRHLAERLPALHDLGLEGLDAPSVAALPGDQLFTLTTLSLWQQEYGASL
ncbi:TPA: hypothetical protein VDU95_001080 [Pseudomonas aeruginosa]|nr:hypothetical protein [Pseudomonas aeruginosa]